MTNTILRLDASLRETGSYSRKLADDLISELTKQETSRVINRDLANGIPLINGNWIKANVTPFNERTQAQHDQLALSDQLIDELKSADQLVVALPIYNFGVPAAFKAWIDLVSRSKVTFTYTDTGPKGLLTTKKLYIIVTSGGTQLGSELDFISDYLRHIFGFIGLSDVTFIDSTRLGKDTAGTLLKAHTQIKEVITDQNRPMI